TKRTNSFLILRALNHAYMTRKIVAASNRVNQPPCVILTPLPTKKVSSIVKYITAKAMIKNLLIRLRNIKYIINIVVDRKVRLIARPYAASMLLDFLKT